MYKICIFLVTSLCFFQPGGQPRELGVEVVLTHQQIKNVNEMKVIDVFLLTLNCLSELEDLTLSHLPAGTSGGPGTFTSTIMLKKCKLFITMFTYLPPTSQ